MMEFEINIIGDIHHEQELHEHTIKTFKYIFDRDIGTNIKSINIVRIGFNYYPETRKFEVTHVPNNIKGT